MEKTCGIGPRRMHGWLTSNRRRLGMYADFRLTSVIDRIADSSRRRYSITSTARARFLSAHGRIYFASTFWGESRNHYLPTSVSA
jgi:hypothetical protein